MKSLIFPFLAVIASAADPYVISDILTANTLANSRSTDWKPGQGITLEVSGMDWLPDGRLAVALRKGEVWLLGNVHTEKASDVTYKLFASGLHEPLGLRCEGKDLLITQRSELTRLRDVNGDDQADEYLTDASGWGVSGAYHGYAYGPKQDGQGQDWMALNVDMGDHSDNKRGWRGWAVVKGKDGNILPMAAGLRSPCGLGANREGDMFCVDQQGTWVPATPVFHLRKGIFMLNQEGLPSQNLPGSPLKLPEKLPNGVPYPEALRSVPQMVPPAVWLPYNKAGRSGTDIVLCNAKGRFGPYDGQLFVAEFTDAKINRVFLEKVDGEYQGAVFPFVGGFASGIVRLSMSAEGQLFVGMTSRGWSSLGTRAYGLQRVKWNGVSDFAIKEMRALPDGFELTFTEPVDAKSATNTKSYSMTSYTYLYSGAYGSDEIDTKTLAVTSATINEANTQVRLKVSGLRPIYVHELQATGIRSASGQPLKSPAAYYTLNRIPTK
ncbi:MAG: hypothetical protein JNJ83_09310 [Verrucomicrobiaceae bacterium]|nr:hypothetical protein [Verrucomicrobiaceae bacterium]